MKVSEKVSTGEEYVSALRWQLDKLQTAIETDREQVKRLLQAISEREQQAEMLIRLLEAEGESLDAETLDKSTTVSIADTAHQILAKQQNKQPIYYRDLAERIEAEGKLIPGQDPAANLISYLSRDNRFVRVARGTYGLAEWGLNIKEPSRPKKRSRDRK